MKSFFTEDRIFVLDGAMGTMLQKHGLTGPGQDYNLSSPETVASIHREYVDAGADIIETNTFSGGYDTSLAGARIARGVADKAGRKVIVAGSIGPGSKSLSICDNYDSPDSRAISFDEMACAYREQIRGLLDGGVDALLLETCFDALNAKAAIYAWDELGRKVPVIVSGTVSDGSGRLLTGQTLEAFYVSVSHCNPVAFGLNCGLGAEKMLPLIQETGRFAACPVICYPNAGLPDGCGHYTQSPSEMAAMVRTLAETGLVNITGGCCGSTPEHIRAIAEAVRGLKPFPKKTVAGSALSGLEPFALKEGKIEVSRCTNAEFNPEFAGMIRNGDYDGAMCLAAEAVCGGAGILDINMDAEGIDGAAAMGKFVRYIMLDPSVSKASLMIDSSDFEVTVEGLRNAQGRCLAFAPDFSESDFKDKALKLAALGAAIAVRAVDDESFRKACSILSGTDIIDSRRIVPFRSAEPPLP